MLDERDVSEDQVQGRLHAIIDDKVVSNFAVRFCPNRILFVTSYHHHF